MASAVQWIKITTDIFDDEKILLIDSMPEADKIIIIWFKLLCLAGKQNNKGVFMFKGVPYTTQMLSTILHRDEDIIKRALTIFEDYGRIHYENNAIVITNWGKHQSLDKIEANAVYMREYMREYRKKQRDVANCKDEHKVNDKVNGKVNINSPDKDTEKDKDKENNKEDNSKQSSGDDGTSKINYNQIVGAFNEICKSLPKVAKLNDRRRKALKDAQRHLGNTTFEDFFKKVEASDFLTGRKTDWRANFDWIIAQYNMLKILEGNFDNRNKSAKENYTDISKYQNMKMEV